MKIAINRCYGGFSLSQKAQEALATLGIEDHYELKRNDPKLIEVIEKLGPEANSRFSELKIVEIPDDVEWEIKEYDGQEWVAEKHRTWC